MTDSGQECQESFTDQMPRDGFLRINITSPSVVRAEDTIYKGPEGYSSMPFFTELSAVST